MTSEPSEKPAPSAGIEDGPQRASQRAHDLARILHGNPIHDAYLINYLANFYVGPLLKLIDARHRLTRPEWIILFCLSQHDRLNAQQISDVTGRPKSSISHAMKLLERKKLLHRIPDPADGRRHVLKLTASGNAAYRDIIGFFIEREKQMFACLSSQERSALRKLMLKLVGNMECWARSY
jgi:DNA-binding MarR family transcriptional regulator